MQLNKKVIVVIGLVAVIAVTALLIRHFVSAQQAPAFRFTTVKRGDIQALVSATGTLNAVMTVSVGTQVSGQVSAESGSAASDRGLEVRVIEIWTGFQSMLLVEFLSDELFCPDL